MNTDELMNRLLKTLESTAQISREQVVREIEEEIANLERHVASGEASLSKARERIESLKNKLWTMKEDEDKDRP